MKKQDFQDLQTSGVSVHKLNASGKNNSDLCSQLDDSAKFERHLRGKTSSNLIESVSPGVLNLH